MMCSVTRKRVLFVSPNQTSASSLSRQEPYSLENPVKMRLTLVVLALCVALAVAWDNDWDKPLHKVCSHGTSFVRVCSVHSDRKEDRRYWFSCGSRAPLSHQCYWTGYVNSWDGPMNFECSTNYVVTGVYSYHDNGKEDRRFKFKCCQQKKNRQKYCHWTGYINQWDGPMDYGVGSDSVITGFKSYHSNRKEDRVWQVRVCRLAK